jgi:hypothetical protein
LANWTASWIAFEFSGTPVEVEISKVGGAPINKAMVRPVGHASAARIENGKAYVIFDKPSNVNVDIDGQLEDNIREWVTTDHQCTQFRCLPIPFLKNPIYQIQESLF